MAGYSARTSWLACIPLFLLTFGFCQWHFAVLEPSILEAKQQQLPIVSEETTTTTTSIIHSDVVNEVTKKATNSSSSSSSSKSHTVKLLRPADFPPPPPSEYTRRTGNELPHWAQKFYFIPYPNRTAGEKSVCFVHVGKTAGTTLACYLGFHYDCGDRLYFPRCHLRDQTAHLIHNWINDCHDDDYYLFALRDPVTRMKSWFNYERPGRNSAQNWVYELKKPLFVDCPFNTFHDLIETGLLYRSASNVSQVCRRRAFDAIRGYQPYSRHNFYNYQYFRNETPANATILAIRTEHLETDWASAEKVLADEAHDDKRVNMTFPRRNPSFSNATKEQPLSEAGKKQLCTVLCPEIKVYMDLLNRAINLTPEQVEDSLNLLRSSCPDQVDSTDKCPYFPFEQ